jgi:3-phenylpropionate/trans-cinnamate dioxygenase ferredoxin subunit
MDWARQVTISWKINMNNFRDIDQQDLEYIAVGSTGELFDGQRLFVEVDDLLIVIMNISGKYYAIADVCSHDDGPVGEGNIEGYEIICPRHGARFDVRTGKALALPAFVDIPSYPVRLVSGNIEIGIPIDR